MRFPSSQRRRSPPLTLMRKTSRARAFWGPSGAENLFLLRGSAEFFDFTLPWVAGGSGGRAGRARVAAATNEFQISHKDCS